MLIDPTKTCRMVEERLGRESDPVRRRNLETVLAHMKAEAVPDPGVPRTRGRRPGRLLPLRDAHVRRLAIDEQGLVIGEDSYVGGDGFAGIADRKLRPEDLAA